MQTLLATAAGAAAMRLLNRKKRPEDMEALVKEERRLKKELETLQREVEAKSRLDQADMEALRKQAEELKKEVDDLSSKAQELEQENVALKDDVEQATQREARLLLQHQELHTQVDTLKQEHAAEVGLFQQQLEAMRSAVADVVSRMLAHSISDAEAAEAVRALGCEIEFIEAPVSAVEQLAETHAAALDERPAWSVTQPGLLLEDKERLQRLVVSGMMRNLETAGSAGSARIPLITFPAAPSASTTSSLAPTGSAKLLTRAASTAAKNLVPSALIADASAQRDQAQPPSTSSSGAASRTARPPPVITTGSTPGKAPKPTSSGIQWTYALQGKAGSTYVAKTQVVHGEAAAPAAYFSSTGSPTLLGTDMDDTLDLAGGVVGGAGSTSLIKRRL